MRFGGWRLVACGAAGCALVALGSGSASAAKPVLSGGQAVSSATSVGAVTSGSWGPGVEAVLPANAAEVGARAAVASASCPSAGNCTAVGGYTDTSGQAQGPL